MNSPKNIVGDWSFMKKIGAKPSDKPFVAVPAIKIHKTTEKLRNGEAISIDEIPEEWKDLDIFLDEQSFPFVFYISDQNIFYRFNRASQYKFHFRWCSTLESMKKQGKEKRYRAKYDICNPFFKINDGEIKKELKVCLNCCKEFSKVYSYFDGHRWNIEEKFRMPEFFEEFGVLNLPPSTHPGGRDGYTRNWPKVSRGEREKAGWKCQDPECKNPGKDYGDDTPNLHVHHIDFVKSNNARDNLEVVCRDCHANKPGHEHLRL